MEQRTEAWYRARAGRITGSRFARAMAGKRSKDYQSLVDELAEERRLGRSVDGGHITHAMQWGIDYEAPARRWYAGQRGCEVAEVGFVVHPRHDYVGVSPDGLVGHDGLIEIKCPQAKAFQRVVASERMPARYRWQVQGQLGVCQRQWADFVCFFPPRNGLIIRVRRDENDLDELESRCLEIHLEVERRIGVRRLTAVPAYSPTPPISLPPAPRPPFDVAPAPADTRPGVVERSNRATVRAVVVIIVFALLWLLLVDVLQGG